MFMDHQIKNFKNNFTSVFALINSGLKNNEDPTKALIKPEYYIKNIIGAYYDRKSTPILPEKEVFQDKLVSRIKIK
jgi:hypothetical protein